MGCTFLLKLTSAVIGDKACAEVKEFSAAWTLTNIADRVTPAINI
jgi:hypothetical protein